MALGQRALTPHPTGLLEPHTALRLVFFTLLAQPDDFVLERLERRADVGGRRGEVALALELRRVVVRRILVVGHARCGVPEARLLA